MRVPKLLEGAYRRPRSADTRPRSPRPPRGPKLREPFTSLTLQHGEGLIVVDQPNTIGALPVTVVQSLGRSADSIVCLVLNSLGLNRTPPLLLKERT